MIVVDASAMVEALVGAWPDGDLIDGLAGDIDAPHLLDVEVLSVLRGLSLSRKLAPEAADQARLDYVSFTIARHEFGGLAERIWELRGQFTTYAASYLALAEVLDAPLFTCDRKLVSDAHGAAVRVFGRSA
ncbi:type II toxin-antitoxin system VapC family toxin [Nocardioides sp. Kera G14]|uniref:type II toxin-antitoxin system VapC family toxin n=1 Tax=Nocardioides sp. Kera G14 TaxID=2884264 RepID=UPI001D0F95EF|nr:type II toxin-antitoxin system VapC family toxin [Nocardioides sp. Kera G14]UDY23662.1 type II toxin-antitoxin system VapC family toxin [Nocardioides sp. Kera G14]